MKIRSYPAAAFVVWMSLLTVGSAAATVIHVPADQPTIQAGINAATNGDTVLVSPGTYIENINFNGKAITVASAKGPKVTIIDGQQRDSVVIFSNKETVTSILAGFTIQNGYATTYITGGGISMQFSSAATITGNIITANQGCLGGGIYGQGGTPVITKNVISKNSTTCGNGSGGGIELDATYGPQIIGNVIENNTAPTGGGGGIELEGLFAPAVVSNNIIQGNHAGSQGGGIYAFNRDPAVVIQNLIVGNTAAEGAGVHWEVPLNEQGPTMVNNTFYGNSVVTGGKGSALFLNGFYGNSILDNNLFIAKPGQSAVYCSGDYSSTAPVVMNNDAYSSGGAGFGLVCSGSNGTNGNISADPMFTKGYKLRGGSPAIDVGDNVAPNLQSKDLAGNPRIVNGNGGSTAIVDMGAYEFIPVTLTPPSLNFGLQAVGSTTTKTVTLTNAQDKPLTISSKTAPTGYTLTGCGTTVAAFSSCSLTVTFHPLTTGLFSGKGTVKDNAGNSPQTLNLAGRAQ
jgi:Right handed beta helix region/Abnormal spindle-like microcephaly-assoc'd, ASPM-SPD-2-Hydin